MVTTGEYVISLAFLTLATVVALSLTAHWNPDSSKPHLLRGLGIALVLCVSALLILVTLANKGDKPWSNIPIYLASFIPLPGPPYIDDPDYAHYLRVPLPKGVTVEHTDPRIIANLTVELDELRERDRPIPPPLPRSYVVADDMGRFPDMRDENGKPRDDQNFRVGDLLFFNFYFKAPASNPNPITAVGEVYSRLYVEPGNGLSTQKVLIEDFERKIAEEQKRLGVHKERATLMPGDRRWISAIAVRDEHTKWILTQPDLDDFHSGRKTIFLLIELPYLDRDQVHHLRDCSFLQAPAKRPGDIWANCGATFTSD